MKLSFSPIINGVKRLGTCRLRQGEIVTRLVMKNKEKMILAMAAARGVLMRRRSYEGCDHRYHA